jgi:CheY-like chemotaxis protein
VDDDPDLLEVATLALTGLGGYAVQRCASASEALQTAASFSPDLILLDAMMPGVDGAGALRALRDIDATAKTPVVFVTAMVQPQDLAQYDELGAVGVIPKPFDPAALPERLEEIWTQHIARIAHAHRKEFEGLRRTYVGQLPEKIEAMRMAAARLAEGGWDRETLESLHLVVHRMAGSSGLYRMSELSRTAGALEEIVKRLLTSATWPPASSPAELTTLVKAVSRTARTDAGLAAP